jgi:arylsulfatase A-like enzyme
LFPTFLDAAKATPSNGKLLDGESIVPLLKGEKRLSRESIFWHFPGYLDEPVIRGRELDVKTGFRSRPVSVIRKGDWKLHLYHEEWQLDGGREKIDSNNSVELYNLASDIGEHNNLAKSNPGKRDELLNDLFAWFNSTDALIPSKPNATFDENASAQKKSKPGKKNKKKKAT